MPADCIINLVYALGADYRANATFVMNSKTAGAVRKMKDADGRFLWSDGLAAGEPARLMGYPVLICEDMPDIAANTYAIAFGDFRAAYTIAERPDLRILRDPFSAKPNVLFYANKRVGGDITDFAAIKLLKIAVSRRAGPVPVRGPGPLAPMQCPGRGRRSDHDVDRRDPGAVAALPVEEMKDHLRLGSGFADDALQDGLIESYLRAAMAAIEGRIGKMLFQRRFLWVLDCWREAEQALPVRRCRGS